VDDLFLPAERDTAPGAVDDARPDRWGERVIRFIDRPARLSLMEFLYCAGDERFGALGVSTSPTHYEPRRLGPLPTLADTQRMQAVVHQLLANEAVDPREARLVAPGATMGGARPKALVTIDGEPWVVKFNDGNAVDTPLIEHATMTLAARAGIRVAETRAIRLHDGHAVAVRRFDRVGVAGSAQRVHALSAQVVLRAAAEPMGYPELAQWLRRLGPADAAARQVQITELFKRLVFNILMDNTDDHEKNHVVLRHTRGHHDLSTAFDVLPSGQALGYQQMRVGRDEPASTVANALSEHARFGLARAAAEAAVREVARVVSGWPAHFAEQGVRLRDVESLAQQIDRPFLKDQRDAWG
jgi:serine/threonine-protein kinase HipA